VFTIQSISGFDGIVEINSDKDIEGASFRIEHAQAVDLERDVFWEHKVVVCAPCKEILVSLFMSELITSRGTESETSDRSIH